MKTAAAMIYLAANETIAAQGNVDGTKATFEVLPGLYTLAWGEAAKMTCSLECSGGDLQFESQGAVDVLIEANGAVFYFDVAVFVMRRPESASLLQSRDSFKYRGAIGNDRNPGSAGSLIATGAKVK